MYRCTLRIAEADGTTRDIRAAFFRALPAPGRVLTLTGEGRKIRVSGVTRFEQSGIVMTAMTLPS